MLLEIVKAIKWFLLIMIISILATWNAFTLLLKRRCSDVGQASACEMPRDTTSVLSTVYDMINALLFGNTDMDSFQHSDYFPLVAVIFIISMLAMPIVLLNMLIAILGDRYQVIQVCYMSNAVSSVWCTVCCRGDVSMLSQDRALRVSVMMKAQILLVSCSCGKSHIFKDLFRVFFVNLFIV